jgi:hypothetical protein
MLRIPAEGFYFLKAVNNEVDKMGLHQSELSSSGWNVIFAVWRVEEDQGNVS